MQEISGVCTCKFLDTDQLSLWAWKVSGAFEKRAPDDKYIGKQTCQTPQRLYNLRTAAIRIF